MIEICLFPAAGYGTRFLPATKAMPKEMLPILTKPLIQYGVEEALNAGCTTMAIVTGRTKRSIEDHFDINFELENQIKNTSKENLLRDLRNIMNNATFSYTRQKEMKGLGHAILTGETLISHNAFAVILADDLCYNEGGEGVLTQMVRVHEKYRCSVVAIQEVEMSEVSKYGIIQATEVENGIYKISSMVEKPKVEQAPSNLAIIGRYILTRDIFNILRQTSPGINGEIQITDALMEQAKLGRVVGLKFKGKRYDCGNIDGFVQATNDFYKIHSKD